MMETEGHDYYAWTERHRGEFPPTSLVVDDPIFLRQLRDIDPNLEVVNDPQRGGVWCVYRVTFRGAAPSGDLMVHELDLPGAPNSGWITHLRSRALIRPGETPSDIAGATRQWMREFKERLQKPRIIRDANWKEAMDDIKSNMEVFMGRNRRSDARTRRKRYKAKPRWRKNDPEPLAKRLSAGYQQNQGGKVLIPWD